MEDAEMPYYMYTLDGHTPVPAEEVKTWSKWFDEADRRVAKTILEGGVFVSTVFLGVDHSWGGFGPPILFETMVFDPGKPELEQCLEDYTRRYTTWEEAEAGHRETVKQLEGGEATEVKLAGQTG
jgi:hypothetical protein